MYVLTRLAILFFCRLLEVSLSLPKLWFWLLEGGGYACLMRSPQDEVGPMRRWYLLEGESR